MPQFRLCDDEGLVSAVMTPGYKPTLADHEALEQCFQRGLLRCDGLDSNTCDQVAECDTYAKDWEACADKGKYLHCSGGAPGERGCKNTAETCAHGILARYKLKPASAGKLTGNNFGQLDGVERATVSAIYNFRAGSRSPSRPRPRRTRSSRTAGTRTRTTRSSWAARTSRSRPTATRRP